MKRNSVDKLYKLENGLPLSMDEIEELTMLLVQADPDDSNNYPFGSVKSAKLSWIQQALGSTNSRSAGMNSKGQGGNQAQLCSQLHST